MKKTALTLILTFVVLFFANDNSMAQRLGFKGIGGRFGFTKPENIDLALAFGANVHLGELIENLVLYPGVDYWAKSKTEFGIKQTTKSFTINGDLCYYFPTEGSVDFFAGSGLAFSFNSVDTPGNDFSENDVGLNLLGGVDFSLSKNIVVTLKAIFLISDSNAFKMYGGLTYILGE